MESAENGTATRGREMLESASEASVGRMPAKGVSAGSESGSARTKPKRKSSAVSSGRRMVVHGNSTSAWARRYRDIVAGHVSDLGGRAALSESELSLIKRASTLELECE